MWYVGGRCGFSSDIFSLGIVMWELASQVGTTHACSTWCKLVPENHDWHELRRPAVPQLQPLCSKAWLSWPCPGCGKGPQQSHRATRGFQSRGSALRASDVVQERPTRGCLRPLNSPQDCPADLAHLIDRCLMTDPAMRPSASEVVRLLQNQGDWS